MSQLDIIGVPEAAELSGRSVATVKRAALTGQLPVALKMPGKTGAYLFTRQAVIEWAGARGVAA
jgi:hypothetical protein